jgi:hypothetical protein
MDPQAAVRFEVSAVLDASMRVRAVNTVLIEVSYTNFTLFIQCIVIQLLQFKPTKTLLL